MDTHHCTIAVTGLNATDNPGPGVSVLRALRAEPSFQGRLIGLTYDTLDPGIYARELDLAASFLIPYPSQGTDALRERLLQIHARIPIDILIPNLDSELPAMLALEPELKTHGIHMYLPSRAQLDARAKVKLAELGRQAGIDVPESRVLSSASEVYGLHEDIGYPLMLKGVFYGAKRADSLDEALAAFHHTAAQWGLPIIVQRFYPGDELNVVAVGDGLGGLVGAVPMKKLVVTDKGKGWAGVTIRDPELLEMTRRFMRATRWRGPCELEVLRTAEGRYLLIEVNPRFPAWAYLSAGAGQNLPWVVAQLAAGEEVGALPDFRTGTLFVRIAVDQIASIQAFQQVASSGELLGPSFPSSPDLEAA